MKIRNKKWVGAALCALVLLLHLCFPQLRCSVCRAVYGGREDAVRTAFAALEDAARQRGGIGDAVEAFRAGLSG